uniref:Uncharacterized protein n=1 Tax=Anguilla anguilla TaxID=7936 RepID=A0A0E9WTA2_ANGAN
MGRHILCGLGVAVAGKMRKREISRVRGFIVWTYEVVYEFCLLKWGENVQKFMF